MNNILSNLFSKYGFSALIGTVIAVVIAVIIVWIAAHNMSAPGEKVSVIWGLVEYTKPSDDVDISDTIDIAELTEEINFKPESQQIAQQMAPIAIEIEHILGENIEDVLLELRRKYSLRPLTALESGISICETAPGTYFFTFDAWIGVEGDEFESDIQRFEVHRYLSSLFNLEFHNTSEGALYLIGFVSNTHVAEISELTGIERKSIILSSSWHSEFPNLVRLPVSRILISSYRRIDLSEQEHIGVLDLELQ